jgi:hypothetical protein
MRTLLACNESKEQAWEQEEKSYSVHLVAHGRERGVAQRLSSPDANSDAQGLLFRGRDFHSVFKPSLVQLLPRVSLELVVGSIPSLDATASTKISLDT